MAKTAVSLHGPHGGPHGPIPHGWRAGAALVLSAVAGGIILLLLWAVSSVSTSQGLPARARVHEQRVVTSGTVLQIHRQTTGADILLRTSGQNLSHITMGSANSLLSGDGRTMTSADIRLGDTLAQKADGRISDRSQTWTGNLRGTVEAVTSPNGSPVIVRIDSSHTIVVDVGSGTRITSQTPSTMLADADQVTLSGMLDQALGEMTQTAAIVRLGP